ncbi:MAG: 50S ribosomal protein L1 [Chlamydiae bacterium RIFCSPHIGHO2_12_FULL_27_8]|nr:MAG: 50S ribosomal protein L1 [Chlamydiae bacterium RIFCSPHIGHO2_12_FULL_27_8]OGN65385.1 MAG: 50S ribosomal protein L1 [Chlamydiae bacterium RIFCSPLOWO2_01_FULL_28_7]
MRQTKRIKKIKELTKDIKAESTLEEAVKTLKNMPKLKFDESIDLSIKLGVDVKKNDQQVRGTITLPHGTGKKVRILVLAPEDKAKEALKAGADFAGSSEYIDKINNGWTDFDALIATPDMMREVGKLGKVLGPRGLMPSPKAGTVTPDVTKAINELKTGKIEFKVDKQGVINIIVGKLSFEIKNLIENIKTLVDAINKVKPASSKGVFLRNVVVSSTMGPGIKIDINSLS